MEWHSFMILCEFMTDHFAPAEHKVKVPITVIMHVALYTLGSSAEQQIYLHINVLQFFSWECNQIKGFTL